MNDCSLCGSALPKHAVLDDKEAFCCMGCHAVYHILLSKKALEGFQSHPVFLQALQAGLISNPDLLEQLRKNQPKVIEGELEKVYFEVTEMWCPSCAEIIKLMLLRERGVKNCVVDYATDLASVEFSPRHIAKERIHEVIRSLGYQTQPLQGAHRSAVSFSLYLRFVVAAFCALNIMMFSYPIYASYFAIDENGYAPLFAWFSLLISLPVVSYSLWPIIRRFWGSLQVGVFGMETLVLIGVSSAFTLSCIELYKGGTHVYFDSMSVIVTFVLLGKIIESKAKFTAKDSLFRLNRMTPKRGRKVFADGQKEFVPIKDIQAGDCIVVLTGEKIVLDGVIVEGEAACDESVMTGESVPVHKTIGSVVLAGTFVQNGSLTVRVTASSDETALHKIIEMIEHDIGHKSHYVRVTDVIVRSFVPVVFGISLFTGSVTYLVTGSFDIAWVRSVSILLISCPCAIGIAVPLAESHLIQALAQLGALVRNRACLPKLGKETVFIFDKTGTVTEGNFQVLKGLKELSTSQLESLKGLATQSTHPLATAIASSIQASGAGFDRIEELAGKGLRGFIGDTCYLLGSEAFMRLQGVPLPIQEGGGVPEREEIVTTVYFARDKELIATLELGDRIRKEIPEIIMALKPTRTALVSGDANRVVQAVAKMCGFNDYRSAFNPLEKRNFVEKLRKRGEIVCMLGDGINDAPALTEADIGMSVVSATDISIQVSDILLTTDNLNVIPKIRHIAQKGHRILKQNLFWAFFYNVIGIGLACFGYLTPLFAAFAMITSSLLVLYNSRRLNS